MAGMMAAAVAAQRTATGAGWGAKAVLVFVLAGLMAIPGLFVFGLVLDRQHRADQVTSQVSDLQGGPQQLLGPMLIAPYTAPRPPANDASGVPHPQPPETGWYVVSPDQGAASVQPEGGEPAPQHLQRAGLRGDGQHRRALFRAARRAQPARRLAGRLAGGADRGRLLRPARRQERRRRRHLRPRRQDRAHLLASFGDLAGIAGRRADARRRLAGGQRRRQCRLIVRPGLRPGRRARRGQGRRFARDAALHRRRAAERDAVRQVDQRARRRRLGRALVRRRFPAGDPAARERRRSRRPGACRSSPAAFPTTASAQALSLDQLGPKDLGVSLVPASNPYQTVEALAEVRGDVRRPGVPDLLRLRGALRRARARRAVPAGRLRADGLLPAAAQPLGIRRLRLGASRPRRAPPCC